MKTATARMTFAHGFLSVALHVVFSDECAVSPRLGVRFSCGEKSRRLPLVCEENSPGSAVYRNRFLLPEVFYRFTPDDTLLTFIDENGAVFAVEAASPLPGGITEERGAFVLDASLMQTKVHRPMKEQRPKDVAVKALFRVMNLLFKVYRKIRPPQQTLVTFMSGRRTDLDGNLQCVYDALQATENAPVETLLFHQSSGVALVKNAFRFMKLYAASRVVVIDDYFRLLNYFDKPEGTKVFQLWHACGAFKTFGYSRLGKPGAPSQWEPNHRMYDYAIVSSGEVARHYAEGFGISDSAVLSTGIPRCDMFFDEKQRAAVREKLYRAHPMLRGKKVLLFAPTFRGNGQQSAYYPMEMLDAAHLADTVGEEWAVVMKLHPFCKERPDTHGHPRVLDLSDTDELNELLFVTDLLVTDYSSAIFEASLLNIPMLFYVFDLQEYIAARDFYYRFETLAPGRIVTTQTALEENIKNNDFETESLMEFRKRFFDHPDGGASARVAEKIREAYRG